MRCGKIVEPFQCRTVGAIGAFASVCSAVCPCPIGVSASRTFPISKIVIGGEGIRLYLSVFLCPFFDKQRMACRKIIESFQPLMRIAIRTAVTG